MKQIIIAALLFISVGCTSSEYRIVEPRPTLALSKNTANCELGQAVNITLTVDQEGVDGNFSISAFIRQGKAQISIEGREVQTTGQWVTLDGKTARIDITPEAVGELVVNLQAKAPSGETSDQQELSVTVTAPSQIAAEAACEAKIINLEHGAKIPVQLRIDGKSPDGKFMVTPSISQGQGKIFLEGNIVNDAKCPVDENTTFEYFPEVIGEQILEFQVTTSQATAKARAYMDVVRNIVVTSTVEGCFSIEGAGEYNTEGQEITLALVNDELFNFEAAGWYDASGNLLSAEETYSMKLSTDCITDIEVRLKQRNVTITRTGIAQLEYQYLVMENGRPVPKVAYDYRTQYSADYKASEPIKFYYEEYRLDKSKIPPPAVKKSAAPALPKGATKSGYFWRYDKKYTVYLRESDNPGFKFNFNQRYIESANTKYYLPPDITMMK